MPYCPSCGQEFVAGVLTCADCAVPLQDTPPTDDQRATHPDEQVVDVFVTNSESEAHVVQGLLEVNGIACRQHSGVPQNVLPLHVDTLEDIRIFVAEHDAETARTLIATQQSESGDG